ncbi:sigma-E factor negative regulatory protein [Ramlibacter sp. PS4R-6]|uniref:sigma-E factor negative regulatory protein n=1 Tax=Ramlibacter sp. PS4R-6 TaxID=3133438 RepID=UPI0030A2E4ED
MENMDKREMVSALADGQLAGEAFARGVEIASTDEAAREAWHAYHLIGDVLRSSDLAHCAPSDGFLARLQERLREEPAAAFQAAALVAAAPRATEAANDGSFRWKVVAGAASFAAVSAIAWTLIGTAPGRQEGAQLAASRAAGGTVLTSSERGVMIRDPRLDEFMAAHRQLGGATLVAPAGYLRNATFDTPAR